MERCVGKNSFTEAALSLTQLYGELPPVSCTSCGKCCSSPHITFVEAMHLFTWLFSSKSRVELEGYFNEETIAQKFAYNYKCRFENVNTKMCEVHPARGFVCRVYGYPVLDRMGISNMDNCREPDRPVIPNVRQTRMQIWLDRLGRLNEFHNQNFNCSPYHVTGFNIETWLDIAVTDYGRQPFTYYHHALGRLPFNHLNLSFFDRTHLSTRLAKIDLFHQANRGGQKILSRRLIENLITSEPLTGSFFRYEAQRYLSRIPVA